MTAPKKPATVAATVATKQAEVEAEEYIVEVRLYVTPKINDDGTSDANVTKAAQAAADHITMVLDAHNINAHGCDIVFETE